MNTKLISSGIVILVVLVAGCSAPVQNASPPDSNQTDDNATDSVDNKYNVLEVKNVVVSNVNPGTCFGMPKIVSEEQISKYINDNNHLSMYVREECDVSEKKNIYQKVKQFQQVKILNKTSESSYLVEIKDGNCCNIHTITARVNMEKGTVNVLNKSTENVPC